ncbi:hypothetical protein [Spirosoma terrae]|uniref:hypothetical protein n=1 Tax=Spirosoma terrae TaxID=1968276 RepID=UPI00374499B2
MVSESFGNKIYVMERGKVCDVCNSRFSNFEKTALANTVFIMERARFGVASKKGNTAKGKVGQYTIEGNKEFKRGYIKIDGLTEEDLDQFDPETGVGKLLIKSFDKSEVAASKLLLKTGLEAIYTSQRKIYEKYNFQDLKDFLSTANNKDWPFLTSDYEVVKYNSVPKFTIKYYLKIRRCDLKFYQYNDETLLFKFKYGSIPMVINLLNRNLNWIKEVTEADNKARLFPEHYRSKILKKL